MELTDDCTDVKPETDVQLFYTPNREAPAMFSYDDHYYLWTSGTWGWSPCGMFLYRSSSPLGAYNTSIGHTYHSYTKGATFNKTHTYDAHDGYLATGDDWNPVESNMTLEKAESLCGGSDACKGFTFVDFSRNPERRFHAFIISDFKHLI